MNASLGVTLNRQDDKVRALVNRAEPRAADLTIVGFGGAIDDRRLLRAQMRGLQRREHTEEHKESGDAGGW